MILVFLLKRKVIIEEWKDKNRKEKFNKNIKKLTNIRKNNKSSLENITKMWYTYSKKNEFFGSYIPIPVVQLRGQKYQMASENCITV